MSGCEKCWAESGGNHDAYMRLIKSRENHPCTAKEQAGMFWDENRQRDKRFDEILTRALNQ